MRPRYGLALLLLVSTFFTTTTLGAVFLIQTRTDIFASLVPWLTPRSVAAVWSDPALLRLGLSFSLAVLAILLVHELGHYLACRRYGLAATLPYFLPAPFGIGTVGAFIKIRAPIRGKRELFDVGASGPFAGFLALLPFLFLGLARSRPVPLADAVIPPGVTAFILVPGRSLLFELVSRLFHGPLPAGTVLDLHPLALAAWFGLLATAINLLPLGQLDGGHILYAATGRLQRRLALGLWALLALGSLLWPGWLVWSAIVLMMGLRHPPVRDEAEPLGRGRQALALLALLLFVGCFMPVPMRDVVLR
ncbi:MAG TPA: site-2 protease family protein [Thermoanaerobaculia bacterium]|nr:site-2 protease family protein [Thermoanaerobaculia bacterium]